MMKKWGLITCMALVALFALSFQSEVQSFFELDPENKLILPDPGNYRKWELIGTGAVPDDLNRNRAIFPGVHLVFIDPLSLKHRRESGYFPDGTVLIMENHHQSKREGVSGTGYFESGPQDLLVSIKDRRVFSSSGWSYYYFSSKDLKNGVKSMAPMPKSDCQACHISDASDDQVFVSYYPKLGKAKGKGKPKE